MTDPSFAPFAKKSLGQHWLDDADALQAMVAGAEVQPGDVVLEIGPGYGTLTAQLLAAGAQVTALEFDESLLLNLRKRFGENPAFNLLHGDIRRFNFTELPAGYKVVANIPYYLTSYLIQLLSDTPNPPVSAALLIQREVAERVCAAPGSMSLLSVTAQAYWQCGLGPVVPAALFTPPPKVDSQILLLEHLPQPKLQKDAFSVVKAGFSQKRKTLANSLSGGLRISRDAAVNLLRQAEIEPTRRAQTLSLDEWQRLSARH